MGLWTHVYIYFETAKVWFGHHNCADPITTPPTAMTHMQCDSSECANLNFSKKYYFLLFVLGLGCGPGHTCQATNTGDNRRNDK